MLPTMAGQNNISGPDLCRKTYVAHAYGYNYIAWLFPVTLRSLIIRKQDRPMERKGMPLSLWIVLWLLSLLAAEVSECQDHAGYYSSRKEYDNCPEARCFDPDEQLRDLLCRCDSNCTLYGDCCDSHVPSLDSTGTHVDLLECRSIHLDASELPAWGNLSGWF